MSAPKWVVHVLGPDDIMAQPDRATAFRVAHEINTAINMLTDEQLNDPLFPTVWAVVEAVA